MLFAKTLKTAGIDFRIGGILYGEEIISSLQPTSDIQEFLTFLKMQMRLVMMKLHQQLL